MPAEIHLERRDDILVMTLDDPDAVAMGKEPIMHGQRVLGYVTSADYGYSIGRGILYGYLPISYSKPGTSVDVLYFGRRLRATVAEEAGRTTVTVTGTENLLMSAVLAEGQTIL